MVAISKRRQAMEIKTMSSIFPPWKCRILPWRPVTELCTVIHPYYWVQNLQAER